MGSFDTDTHIDFETEEKKPPHRQQPLKKLYQPSQKAGSLSETPRRYRRLPAVIFRPMDLFAFAAYSFYIRSIVWIGRPWEICF